MSNLNAIEVEAKWGGTEDSGISWARLEYYMEHNPQQKEWRKIPGFVVGIDKNDVMKRAENLAVELSELDIQDLQSATRKLFDDKRMYKQLADVIHAKMLNN